VVNPTSEFRMKRIHDSLRTVLQRHRLVFWYDATREWEKAYETFADEGVRKLTVAGTEFGAKVAIHRAPESRFLVYVPSARPTDSDNWLLDFLLQGHEYKADRASLALQDVGLPYELRPVIEAHVGFFDAAKRVEALRGLLAPNEEPASLRRKFMAVAVGAATPEIDAVLLAFLARGKGAREDDLVDPVQATFAGLGLEVPFWKEVSLSFGYATEAPTLRDFARTLFRAANPLDHGVRLSAHAQVFLQHWKDSQAQSPAYRRWAELMQGELNLANQLEALDDMRALGSSDTFPLFERFVLHRLCAAFENGTLPAAELMARIQQRRGSFWYSDHRHGYAALEQAVVLRELVAAAELKIESIETGIQRYAATWHRIDSTYRKFHFHARGYGQVALLERIVERVEKTYLTNFVLPLADRWGDQVAKMAIWPGDGPVVKQMDFFAHFVRPFLEKKQKVCVIISDALRYEIAVELMERLLAENRWKAELDPMLGVLPSYTQLGMAALLPGTVRTLDPEKRTVAIDGRESAGVEARGDILVAAVGNRAIALKAEVFMEMNTGSEARALIRDHDVVYLYHNIIDDTGDKLGSEAQTTEAVEDALESLLKLIKKVANANGSQVLLTADHGFLFQQTEVPEDDDLPLPAAAEWLFPHRRFALGRGLEASAGSKVFTAVELGLSGDWAAAFPKALGRFPLRGSGKRFVHGGFSLQEVVLPVLRIHKSRTDDTERVEIDLLRAPSKITTGRVTLTLYQDRPTATKTLGRTLRVGIFTVDGVAISELKTLTFDSGEAEARHRESVVDLALSRAADPHNGREVEIRLEELTGGNQSAVPYKVHRLKLQKPFATDFDEL
jgi:uncharacterized protein (TIGR02687 family)